MSNTIKADAGFDALVKAFGGERGKGACVDWETFDLVPDATARADISNSYSTLCIDSGGRQIEDYVETESLVPALSRMLVAWKAWEGE